MPLLQAVPTPSHEKCVQCKHFCFFETFRELLKPFWEVSQSRCSIVVSLLVLLLGFWCAAPGSWCTNRHFALLLDLKMYLMSPAVAMQQTSWNQNLTIQGQQRVRSCPSCRESPSLVRSGVAFDHWPTHRYIRVLRRAFQVIELQACHRVFAPSGKDQDR